MVLIKMCLNSDEISQFFGIIVPYRDHGAYRCRITKNRQIMILFVLSILCQNLHASSFLFLGKFWWITSKTVCILLGKLDKARMNEWLFSNWSSKARHFTSPFDNEKCLKWWNKWPALFFKWTRFFWLQLSPGE